jgi:glycosyltransferase involved in cell wall biosynthesis
MTPPLRVLFPFDGTSIGGSHVSACTLITALDREIVEPITLLEREGEAAEFFRRRGIEIEVARRVPGLAARIAFLRRRRIDVVHTNDARAHVPWGLAADMIGSRHVWHQRTLKWSKAPLTQALLGGNRDVVAISAAMATALARSGAIRVHRIDNPVEAVTPRAEDVARARAEIDALVGCEANRIVAVCGNLWQQKRPFTALEIVAAMPSATVPVVAFIGAEREIGLADLRQRAARLGIADRVCHLGFKSPIEPYLAAADALLAPATGEGFGRTLPEAMRVGTPVIAAADAGHLDIVEHGRNGWLFRPDDVDAAARLLAVALTDRTARSEIVSAARSDATSRYDPPAHARRIEEIYGGQPSPPRPSTESGSALLITERPNEPTAQAARADGCRLLATADSHPYDPSVDFWLPLAKPKTIPSQLLRRLLRPIMLVLWARRLRRIVEAHHVERVYSERRAIRLRVRLLTGYRCRPSPSSETTNV